MTENYKESEYLPHERRFIIKNIFPCLWWSVNIFTCQWLRPMRGSNHREKFCCVLSIVLLFFSIAGALVNLFPTAMFLYDWIKCPIQYHNICYTIRFYSEGGSDVLIPKIVLRDTTIEPSERLDHNGTRELLQAFEDLSKVTILSVTSASSISYLLCVWALCCLYIRQGRIINKCSCCSFWKRLRSCCCCVRERTDEDDMIKPLDPFNDDTKELDSIVIEDLYEQRKKEKSISRRQDDDTNTLLKGERLCHYLIWFSIGVVLLVVLFIVFFWGHYIDLDRGDIVDKITYQWEATTLTFYAYSLICSLTSCFIFSKLMYGVQRKCEELELYIHHVNEVYHDVLDHENFVCEYVRDRITEQMDELTKSIKRVGGTVKTAADECIKAITKVTYQTNDRDVVLKDVDTAKEANTRYNNTLENFHIVPDDAKPDARAVAAAVQTAADRANELAKKESWNYFSTVKKAGREALRHARIANIAANITGGLASASQKVEAEIETIFNEKEDSAPMTLKYLKERDKHFVKMAIATMDWFQLWFLLHWVLHILSGSLVIGLLLDAITLHVKATLPHLEPGVHFHPAEIGFLFMFSLVQCFLFLYPCLRAATVTRTRTRLIQKISEHSHTFSNIPNEVMFDFIKSMRRHKFSFRLRILCARISFNFNVAYISIAIGLIGVTASAITTLAA